MEIKDYEDAQWRAAAESLGLELWSSRGKKVKKAKGTRAHEMRGAIDGFAVRVRYGLRSLDDGVTVIEVTLKRPLMLGFIYRVSSPPRDYRGRRVGAKHIDVLGVERDRVRQMVEDTRSGLRLARLADHYGDTGWLEIDDAAVRAQLDFYTDHTEGYAPLILPAVELAKLAEAARSEIEPAPWEGELAANLARAADALRLKSDPERFRLRGDIRGMTTALSLEARVVSSQVQARYTLTARIALPTPLPSGAEISRRVGFWSKLSARLRLDRPSGNPTFDHSFQATLPARHCLSPDVTETLLALANEGDVHVKSDAISYRTERISQDTSQLLQRLAATAEKLQGRASRTPYRD